MIAKIIFNLLALCVLDTITTCFFSVIMQAKCEKRFALSKHEDQREVIQKAGGIKKFM